MVSKERVRGALSYDKLQLFQATLHLWIKPNASEPGKRKCEHRNKEKVSF